MLIDRGCGVGTRRGIGDVAGRIAGFLRRPRRL